MLKGINNHLFAIFKVSLYCLIVLGIVGVLTVLVVIPWWVRTEEVLVPNVTGKTYYEAVRVLDEAGLRPAETIQEASSSAPKGEIVSQNPPANFRVKSVSAGRNCSEHRCGIGPGYFCYRQKLG